MQKRSTSLVMLNVFPRNPKCLARVTEAPAFHVLKAWESAWEKLMGVGVLLSSFSSGKQKGRTASTLGGRDS